MSGTANATDAAAAALAALDPMPMIGPLFFANSLNWLAFGSLLVQIYHYVQNFTRDKLGIRLLVWGLLALEMAQTATTTHQAWYYSIENWDKPAALLTFPWSAMTVPIGAGIIAAVAQFFYAWRIWLLAPNKWFRVMAVLIVLLALLQSITAIVASVIFVLNLTPEKLASLHPEFELWVAASFVADVLISGSMLWILYLTKEQTMWERSNSIIGKLIVITVGTGTAIALCGALTLALFATTVGASFQYLPAAYVWGKLYSNSIMVSLNARKSQLVPSAASAASVQSDAYAMRIQVSRHVMRSGGGPETWPRTVDVHDADDKSTGFTDADAHGASPFAPSKKRDIDDRV